MKKFLLVFFVFISFLLPKISTAQSFSVEYDTVTANVSGLSSVFDYIINNTSSGLTINWHVIGSNFPSDWLTSGALGICDNNVCYYNGNDMQLWNDTTNTGHTFTSNPYGDTTTHGAFDLSLSLTNTTSTGCYWMTVALVNGTTTKQMTFVICKNTTSVPAVTKTEDVVLYPNPATSELNIVYDASSDIKNIAVYNIIGKVMTVYKVTANNSANLDISNLPSGIYFVRLVNTHGDVVVTKKFTKQ